MLDSRTEDALCGKIVSRNGGRGTSQIGKVVGSNSIVLFGHRSVIAAKSCLDVDQRDATDICR